MKLYIELNYFFDSFRFYDEDGKIIYKGECDLTLLPVCYVYKNKKKIGTIQQHSRTVPDFTLFLEDKEIGKMDKDLTLLKPKYNIRFNGYRIEGDPMGFDYQVYDNQDKKVMSFYKESLFRKNYCLKINDEMNEEICVLITIATLMGGK